MSIPWMRMKLMKVGLQSACCDAWSAVAPSPCNRYREFCRSPLEVNHYKNTELFQQKPNTNGSFWVQISLTYKAKLLLYPVICIQNGLLLS